MTRRVVLPSGGAVRRLRWLAVPAAIALAGASFAQAAAGVGLPVRVFEPWGPSFFAWRPGHQALEAALLRPGPVRSGTVRPETERLQEAARRILIEQPLSAAGLRLMAWSDAQDGREAEAMRRIGMIERITRRDAVAQLWLLEDAVRRDDVPGVLRRYDALMRTQADMRAPLLEKLSGGLASEPVRSGLADYVDAGSPWAPDLLHFAGRQGTAGEAAALLMNVPALPDTTRYRSAYAALVAALARENDFASLRRLYPRLPGSADSSLADPGLAGGGASQGYAPFRWSLTDSAERAARLEGDSLVVSAAPFSVGPAASRLVLPPPRPVALSWTVEPVGPGTGSAYWVMRCRDTGQVNHSPDLLGAASGSGVLAAPQPCAAVDLTLLVDGGTGGQGPSFRLTRLRWADGEGTSR